MMTHLQLPFWEQMLLVLIVPAVVGSSIIWRHVYRAVHPDSKPLRKRKRRRRHHFRHN